MQLLQKALLQASAELDHVIDHGRRVTVQQDDQRWSHMQDMYIAAES